MGHLVLRWATSTACGDGHLDIVAANDGGGSVSVLLGAGDGKFQAQAAFDVGTNPAHVAVGDFNRDGHLDIVTANEGSNTVSVLLWKPCAA